NSDQYASVVAVEEFGVVSRAADAALGGAASLGFGGGKSAGDRRERNRRCHPARRERRYARGDRSVHDRDARRDSQSGTQQRPARNSGLRVGKSSDRQGGR